MSELYKAQKFKKLALKSQLPTVQILTKDVQVLILCLSYFITTAVYCTDNLCTKQGKSSILGVKSAVYNRERFQIKNGYSVFWQFDFMQTELNQVVGRRVTS